MSWQAPEELGNEITVTRRKETVSSKVGLRLNLDESGSRGEQGGNNYLVVTRMAPDSLFADSELAIGMRILSINGLETIDMAAEDATGLIKRIRGDVTLVAAAPAPQPDPEPELEPEPAPPTPVTVTRVKEHTASKIGLRLGVASNGKQLAITKIAPDSIFADSELQPGMIVLSINGLQLHNNVNDDENDDDDDDVGGFSAQDATGLIRRVKGNLTIEAVAAPPESMARYNNDPNDGASIDTSGHLSVDSNGSGSATGGATTRSTTITVSKSSPEQKVGLSLSQSGNGMMITRVDPNGLFGGGRLQPGVRLFSVNNVNVKKLPVPLVRNMIGRVVGELTLIVESSDTTPTTSKNDNRNPSQQIVSPVIEVVNTEYMMGNSSQQQPFPGEVVVAPRPPSERLQAQPREQAPYAVPIEARAYRESSQTKVGIRLRCKTDGSVLIDHIAADGLFQHSGLQTGMRLQSVNGVAVSGRPHAVVVQMIGQTVGDLRLVAAP